MLRRLEEHSEKSSCWRVEIGNLFMFVKSTYPNFPDQFSSWKIVVLKNKRRNALIRSLDHPTSHVGIYKTFWKLAERY